MSNKLVKIEKKQLVNLTAKNVFRLETTNFSEFYSAMFKAAKQMITDFCAFNLDKFSYNERAELVCPIMLPSFKSIVIKLEQSPSLPKFGFSCITILNQAKGLMVQNGCIHHQPDFFLFVDEFRCWTKKNQNDE